MTTAAEIFQKIGKAAEAAPDVATAVDAKFQFNVSGDGGGVFVLNFKQGTTSNFLSTEPASDAQCIVNVSGEDWAAMLAGQLDPMAAFMGGKVKVDGDLSLAMKLPKIMKLAR
ncbi:MAG: SCP2 sterol-binding domain-containing protein [Polyangiales bacterium]